MFRHKDERRHRTLEEGEESINESVTEGKDIKEDVAKEDDEEIMLSDDGN